MGVRDESTESASSKPKSDPQRLSDALGEVLATHDLDLAAASAAIGERWEAIVGADVAAHCRPVGVKAGVLYADVESSVWCQQLQLRTLEILAALRRQIGSSAPTGLRFRVGYAGDGRDPAWGNEPVGERASRE